MSDARQSLPEQEREELEYQRELQELALSLDEAAADLGRNGPVSPGDLRRALEAALSEPGGDFEHP